MGKFAFLLDQSNELIPTACSKAAQPTVDSKLVHISGKGRRHEIIPVSAPSTSSKLQSSQVTSSLCVFLIIKVSYTNTLQLSGSIVFYYKGIYLYSVSVRQQFPHYRILVDR